MYNYIKWSLGVALAAHASSVYYSWCATKIFVRLQKIVLGPNMAAKNCLGQKMAAKILQNFVCLANFCPMTSFG